jgi:hypothetical protein
LGWCGGSWAASREAAKEDAGGPPWCVVNCQLSSQLSRICSLMAWTPSPPHPDPSPVGGEGRILVFFGLENHDSTRRPRKGRGNGVRGIALPAQVLQHSTLPDCLISREAAKVRRGVREGRWVASGVFRVRVPSARAD